MLQWLYYWILFIFNSLTSPILIYVEFLKVFLYTMPKKQRQEHHRKSKICVSVKWVHDICSPRHKEKLTQLCYHFIVLCSPESI